MARTVTYTLKKPDDTAWAGAVLKFILRPETYTATAGYPSAIITASPTAADGTGSVSLWQNANGTVATTYQVVLPSGETFNIYVPAGTSSMDLYEIRAGGVPTPTTVGTLLAGTYANLLTFSNAGNIYYGDGSNLTGIASATGLVFDVTDYGAVGDGVTNDYAAVTSAETAAAAVGGIVFFPPGTYLLGTKLAVHGDVTLLGVGNSSILMGDNLTTAVISSPNTAARYYRVSIRDLSVDNQDKANAGGIGIDFTRISQGYISNVYVTNVETGLKLLGEAYYNDFVHVQMADVVTGVNNGNGANENFYVSLRMTTVTTGVIVDGSDNVVFAKPCVEAFTTGFSIAPSNATQHIAIENPRLEGGTTGIVNGALAQSTIVTHGHVSTVTTTYTNSASATNFAWIGHDAVAWHRPRLGRLILCDDSDNARALIYEDGAGVVKFRNSGDSADVDVQMQRAYITHNLTHTGPGVGFYGTAPIAKQTSVPVTAAGVHAALVALGLIT